MKKLSYIITIIGSLFLLSCSTLKPTKQVDDNQKKIEKEEKKIENTVEEIDKNAKQKKIQTATLAAGIQHSLSAVTNPPTEVKTAKDLNERVISIEDQIINKLQKETTELKEQYDTQIEKMTEKAEEISKQADANKATLDSMSGMFGLNAVMWGLKKFVFSALTGIIIFGVIFLVLRVLAIVNPAAGAAFSIFNMIGSSILGMIKVLTPKAFEMSNFTSISTVDKYKSPLVKIVDIIQELKEKQKDFPEKDYPLKELLTKFDKEMDSHEKDLIDEILSNLKWKR